jgi:hypothetical protein
MYATYTISEYLQSKNSMAEKICAIDNLIDAMLLQMLDAIGNSGTSEYQLDDGQIKISTTYRSMADIQKGVGALEQLKQMYVNRLTGRVIRLQDEKTLRR